MKAKKIIVRLVLLVIGLPLVLVAVVVGGFYAIFYVPGHTSRTLISRGERREYLIHVPSRYDPAKPTPLVISLHGAMLWPATQMKTSGWNRVADEHGFIVVYPSGRSPWGSGTGISPKIWDMNPHVKEMRDVRFISDLIDKLESQYDIDRERIYASGFSNGGGMTFALSCTLSQRIAAVAAVSAAESLPWSWCKGGRPVPMIAFHGTADSIAPYKGGPPSWISPTPLPDISAWVAHWAQRNRCSANAVESRVATDVTRLRYSGCADDADVVLYTIRGGGHTWPGGKFMPSWLVGPTTHNIHATELIWRFFQAHKCVKGVKSSNMVFTPFRSCLSRPGGQE